MCLLRLDLLDLQTYLHLDKDSFLHIVCLFDCWTQISHHCDYAKLIVNLQDLLCHLMEYEFRHILFDARLSCFKYKTNLEINVLTF